MADRLNPPLVTLLGANQFPLPILKRMGEGDEDGEEKMIDRKAQKP